MPSVYRLVGWGYAGLCVMLVAGARGRAPARAAGAPARALNPAPARSLEPAPAPRPVRASPSVDAAEWFRRVKPYCNSVEVTTLQRSSPPPASVEGAGYHAACLALAGKVDDARRAIDALADHERPRAANIVFEIGHPVADAGDDRSAGPIMELVIDYVPGHFMALYHAGMAEYMLGQSDLAKRNLTEFLRFYPPKDGWRSNAEDVLRRLDSPAAATADPRRPREP